MACFTGGEFLRPGADWGMEPRTAIRLRGLESVRVAGRCVPLASTTLSRLMGLSLLDRKDAGGGLLIPCCRSVHTFMMRFPLDVHFIDADGRVIRTVRSAGPGRVFFEAGADCVLEVPAEG
jgi:uncharacterized membrane protein (UPF0127 family)